MTEKEIQLLGFEKQEDGGIEVSDDESGLWIEDEFYYYTYDIAMGLSLISNSNDEVGEDGEWFVEIFNTEPAIRFTEFGEVQALINLLQSRMNHKRQTMKKEFVPYELALKLKQLGFDEPCFRHYSNGELVDGIHTNNNMQRFRYSAPLFQQAFRWFREKYDIHYSIDRECSQQDYKWGYNWSLYNYTGIFNEYLTSHPDAPAGEWVYDTYEEAELACLDKLIEIVATKQQEQ